MKRGRQGPASDLDPDVASALDHAQVFVRVLVQDLDPSLCGRGQLNYDRAIEHVDDLDRDLVFSRDRVRNRLRAYALDLDLDFELARDRDLHADLIYAIERVRALSQALSGQHRRGRGVRRDLSYHLGPDLQQASLCAGEINMLLDRIQLALTGGPGELTSVVGAETRTSGDEIFSPVDSTALGQPRPAWPALRLSSLTLQLLSRPARLRYEDELLDELYDLADQSASRQAQVVAALRQMLQVGVLRATARYDRSFLVRD